MNNTSQQMLTAGIILGMDNANQKRPYFARPALISLACTKSYPLTTLDNTCTWLPTHEYTRLHHKINITSDSRKLDGHKNVDRNYFYNIFTCQKLPTEIADPIYIQW